MGRAHEVRKVAMAKTAAAKTKVYSKYGKEILIAAKAGVPIIPVFLEQPRPFKRTRVVYGEPMDLSEANADKKVNKEELVKYRIQWQQEIFKLQEMAVKFENRPIRKLKLKPKHQNNNE